MLDKSRGYINKFRNVFFPSFMVFIGMTTKAYADLGIDDAIEWLIFAVFASAGVGGAVVGVDRLRRRHGLHQEKGLEENRQNAEIKPYRNQLDPEKPNLYQIWYGTNRKEIVPSKYGKDFSNRVNYGVCLVSIPKAHKLGSTGTFGIRGQTLRLFGRPDDRLTISEIVPLKEQTFLTTLRGELRGYDEHERTALIFIHGYNTDFQEAAIRAAQIGFDLGVPGVTAFFSWPSQGSATAYLKDREIIEASEQCIVEFIKTVSIAAESVRINIIAHSMGNLGLLRALTSVTASAALSGVRFGQIFIAAPDIDINLFRKLANIYPKVAMRTTLYISAIDHALGASQFVNRNQRVGYSPPVTVIDGIDTIEATNVDLGLLGHGYYAAAVTVLHDMFALMRRDEPPAKRFGLLEQTTSEGERYWVLRPHLR